VTPQLLRPYLFHPSTWYRWAPQELIDTYVFGSTDPVGIGYSPETGFFVMRKDETTLEESIVFVQQEGIPEPRDITDSTDHYRFAQNTKLKASPKIEGVVLSTQAMQQMLHVPLQALQRIRVGGRTTVTARGSIISFRRADVDLYQLLSRQETGVTPA